MGRMQGSGFDIISGLIDIITRVPVLEYGDFLVDSAPQSHIKQLQIVQNKGLMACLSVKPLEMSTNAIHKKMEH